MTAIAHTNSIRKDIFNGRKILDQNVERSANKMLLSLQGDFQYHFKASDESEKGLCSYFAKIFILWMIETKPGSYWTDTGTCNILIEIFEAMELNLKERSCKNYFFHLI